MEDNAGEYVLKIFEIEMNRSIVLEFPWRQVPDNYYNL